MEKNKKDHRPLFSIITVVYNSVSLIEATIKSIINQTYANYEFIVIDGASTDGTIEVIEKYKENINYLVSEKDKGIYDAMNKGLQAAKGRYVWFMNSGDELYAPDTLEKLAAVSSNADVLYGETMLINDAKEELGTRTNLTTRKLPENLSWKNMINGMVVSHQSFIPKKELTRQFNLNYKCSADIDWVISSLKKAGLVKNSNLLLSKYLIGGFSISNQKRCWKERFRIYLNHYGLVKTFFAHIRIILNNLYFLIIRKKNY